MQDTVLTAEAREFLDRLEREFGPRRRELLAARQERRAAAARRRAARLPARDRGRPRGRVARRGRRRPSSQDRRVEITGPVDRKMVINALNSGAKRVHGRLRGRELAHLAELHRRASATYRCARADDLARRRREGVRAGRRDRRRCSSGRAGGTSRSALRGRRRAGIRLALRLGLYFLRNHGAQRHAYCICRSSRPPRGAALERRLHRRAGARSACRAERSRRPS